MGSVFRVNPRRDRVKSVYDFSDMNGPQIPNSALLRDEVGNLIGTAQKNGAQYGTTVFRISPAGGATVLYFFNNGQKQLSSQQALVSDTAGNLYGTIAEGGVYNLGFVYKLAPDGTLTVLHDFAGGTDGAKPYSGVIIDKRGNLYGTTPEGGDSDFGTIFKISPNGKETILYRFDLINGALPWGSLLRDKDGNLYGTTNLGGHTGVIYKLGRDGTYTVLHALDAFYDEGEYPFAGVVADNAGNLYGTAAYGGEWGCGTVFELLRTGDFKVLHAFDCSDADGAFPIAELAADDSGNFWGTTPYGPIFELQRIAARP
jgi:uncharacterized repeat protein (TIGR03803 family)